MNRLQLKSHISRYNHIFSSGYWKNPLYNNFFQEQCSFKKSRKNPEKLFSLLLSGNHFFKTYFLTISLLKQLGSTMHCNNIGFFDSWRSTLNWRRDMVFGLMRQPRRKHGQPVRHFTPLEGGIPVSNQRLFTTIIKIQVFFSLRTSVSFSVHPYGFG